VLRDGIAPVHATPRLLRSRRPPRGPPEAA